MSTCLYLLRKPVAGIDASLFVSGEAACVLLEKGLPDSSTSFAETGPTGGPNDSSHSVRLTDLELLDLVFAHAKVIVL